MDAPIILIEAAARPLLVVFILASGLVGILAIISPRVFAVVTSRGNQWIDTWRFFRTVDNPFFRRLDKWVDLDRFAVEHSRLTGFAMLAVAFTLAYAFYLG